MVSICNKEYKKGVLYIFLAYFLWGILPVYWKELSEISSLIILAYRTAASFIFVLILSFFLYERKEIYEPLKNSRNAVGCILCGALIAFNWGIYIWAVNNCHIIEASMGYYINPLITVLFSVVFFREKLDHYQTAAIFSAAAGVLIMILKYRKIPFIALSLAVSFAMYGVLKKKMAIDAILSLLYETAFLFPFAFIFIVIAEISGNGAAANGSLPDITMLLLSGVVTATPLLLFAAGTNRINFSTVGFLQYISPSISLIIGIFAYSEKFEKSQIIAFIFIWAGLIIYTLSGFGSKNNTPE